MSKIIEIIKNHKLLVISIAILLFLLLVVSLLGGHANQARAVNTRQSAPNVSINDTVAGDDAAESLNALTEEIHAVVASNAELKANNEKLNRKNAAILSHIKQEVQQNLQHELTQRGQDDQQKITQLQQELQAVNTQLSEIHTSNATQYAVDGQNTTAVSHATIDTNGEALVTLPNVVGSSTPQKSNHFSALHGDAILHPNGENSRQEKPKSIPYFTIPNGATLARAITMSALIGRVPVNGTVKSPYPFKMIIGSNNMAANGLYIPGISGAIIQGYTVGDMALSCVKGYITAMTFVFPDGRISTTRISNSNMADLGFNNSLGYISESNGNPCFSGTFYSNAPEYLTTMIALGGINTGGAAFQQAQMTNQSSSAGGVTSSLTGSIGKAMLGGFAQGSTQQVMNWYTEREKNSFDAVYVPSGQQAVINISKQIDINYNPTGRKISYENANHNETTAHNTSLD